MNAARISLQTLTLTLLILTFGVSQGLAQGAKMNVGQAGVNPGAGLFVIAEKENLYKKHGLDVSIVKTNTTAAVQAMLGGSMQMATGAGAAAFVTATLEGAPPFVLVVGKGATTTALPPFGSRSFVSTPGAGTEILTLPMVL